MMLYSGCCFLIKHTYAISWSLKHSPPLQYQLPKLFSFQQINLVTNVLSNLHSADNLCWFGCCSTVYWSTTVDNPSTLSLTHFFADTCTGRCASDCSGMQAPILVDYCLWKFPLLNNCYCKLTWVTGYFHIRFQIGGQERTDQQHSLHLFWRT